MTEQTETNQTDQTEPDRTDCPRFTLDVDMVGSVFGDDPIHDGVFELARILRTVADRLEAGDYHPGHTQTILEYNGNRVGGYKIHPR